MKMMGTWGGSGPPILEYGEASGQLGDKIPAQPTLAEKIADVKIILFLWIFKC